MASTERFALVPYFRFLLIIRFLGPIAFIGIIIAAISTPAIELSTWGPLILLALVGWAIYEGIKCYKWYNFSVTLHDSGLQVKEQPVIPWNQFQEGWAQDALHFETFIQLTTQNGETIEIPAVIQNNQLLHSALKKNIPSLQVKS